MSLSYDGTTLANATYDRELPNQAYFGDETYVEEGTQVNLTCLAKGAKPEAILTWTKNGDPIDTIISETTMHNSKENRTFDSISTLQFTATEANVTITFNSSLNGTGTNIETSVSTTFLTYGKKKNKRRSILMSTNNKP